MAIIANFRRLLLLLMYLIPFVALLVLLLHAKMAHAADPSTTIDFSSFVNTVLFPIFSAFVLALGTWAVQQVSARLKLQNSAALQKVAEEAMTNGLAYAQSKTNSIPMTVDAKNAFVKIAADYVQSQIKDELTKMNVTGDMLAQKLEARLSKNITPPELSAAVPTPPLPAAPAQASAVAVAEPKKDS